MPGVAAAEQNAQPVDYLARNRAFWEGLAPEVGAYGDQVGHGRRRWAEPAPVWGDWSVPETELGLLPGDVADTDVLELGCGPGTSRRSWARWSTSPNLWRTDRRDWGFPDPFATTRATNTSAAAGDEHERRRVFFMTG